MSLLNILFVIPVIILCGEFWRYGGDGHSYYRNPLVPIIIGVYAFLMFSLFGWHSVNLISLLYIPALWGMIQAFSYGISAPPHKFWVWVFGKGSDGNYKPVEVLTRATCGFFWSLPGAIFAAISWNWNLFIIYSIFLTIANGLIGGLVKDVEKSERGVGICVAMSLLI